MNLQRSPYDVMAKVLDHCLEVTEFKLPSYYVPFWEKYGTPYLHNYGLNCMTSTNIPLPLNNAKRLLCH